MQIADSREKARMALLVTLIYGEGKHNFLKANSESSIKGTRSAENRKSHAAAATDDDDNAKNLSTFFGGGGDNLRTFRRAVILRRMAGWSRTDDGVGKREERNMERDKRGRERGGRLFTRLHAGRLSLSLSLSRSLPLLFGVLSFCFLEQAAYLRVTTTAPHSLSPSRPSVRPTDRPSIRVFPHHDFKTEEGQSRGHAIPLPFQSSGLRSCFF